MVALFQRKKPQDSEAIEGFTRTIGLIVIGLLWITCTITGAAVSSSAMARMALVEPGTFQMGNTRGDSEGWEDEMPVHTVELSYAFWIAIHTVTFDSYDHFCDSTTYGFDKPDSRDWERGNLPVVNISWWEALAYCNWLSRQEGLPVAYRLQGQSHAGHLLDAQGNLTRDLSAVAGYRLPTEAEWEYAARGGHLQSQDFAYAGSDAIEDVAWYMENWGKEMDRPQPAGQKRPNALDLYDMSGNVWEWCYDWFGPYDSDRRDPIGPPAGTHRVIRGGDWISSPLFCRISFRSVVSLPGARDFRLGLRVVRTAM